MFLSDGGVLSAGEVTGPRLLDGELAAFAAHVALVARGPPCTMAGVRAGPRGAPEQKRAGSGVASIGKGIGMQPNGPRFRHASGPAVRVHVRVDEQWRRGSLWEILRPLSCAGCGRPLHPGDLVVRGLGLPPDQQQAVLCTAACRPFHLSRPPEPGRDRGDLLTRGVPIGFDPGCQVCRDELREEERQRALAARPAAPEVPAGPTWLLLVYAVPAEPSAPGAAVWRVLKRVGAVSLRDGVCVLPESEPTLAAFRAVAAELEAAGGRATLVRGGRLDSEQARQVEAQLRGGRRAEYGEAAAEAEHLLEHIRCTHGARSFSFEALEALEADLDRVRRRVELIRARDHFGEAEATAIDDVVHRCEDALTDFAEEASRRDVAAS
jgi:hypothetical protein